MLKSIIVFTCIVSFVGCATLTKMTERVTEPTWSPYEVIVPNSLDELNNHFQDLSGRADARDKIRRLEFIKMGEISYDFGMTTPFRADYGAKEKELMQRAKELGGDAVYRTFRRGDERGKVIRFVVVRYK